MDLEWKKLDAANWPNCRWFWYSDFNIVELVSPEFFLGLDAGDVEGCVYAEAKIDYPDPPKKERHRCEHSHLFVCYESEYGELRLAINNRTYIPIKFCPFCGFSKDKK